MTDLLAYLVWGAFCFVMGCAFVSWVATGKATEERDFFDGREG